MAKLKINSIDDLITAYKNDLINNDTLFHILEHQMALKIAVWVDDKGYSGSKEETLQSLAVYKSFVNSGKEVPLFFFPASEKYHPNKEFNFNEALGMGE